MNTSPPAALPKPVVVIVPLVAAVVIAAPASRITLPPTVFAFVETVLIAWFTSSVLVLVVPERIVTAPLAAPATVLTALVVAPMFALAVEGALSVLRPLATEAATEE